MKKRNVVRLLGAILLLEAASMLPSLAVALIYGDGDWSALLVTMGILIAVGLPAVLFIKPTDDTLYAREGFATVSLAWVLLSAFGALPFVLHGMIPNFIDAFFESVSGFTTTGATVMTDFDGLPHGLMFWRSFTHWIGGMGVLVLSLALLPHLTGRASHLARVESPGPSFSKIVPKLGDTAKILYLIYAVLTAVELVLLMIAGMGPYDAAIHAMGTAGTGGFSNYGASVGAFASPAVDIIITIFMVLFGINFALYFRMLTGGVREAFRSEELNLYLCVFVFASVFIGVSIIPEYGSFATALRFSSFQVSSVMSTTGYATADFNLWPPAVKMLIVLLMLMGSCAGSTAGGIKMVRIALLYKLGRREIGRTFRPRKVQVISLDGKRTDENMLAQVAIFFLVYAALFLVGAFLVSLEGKYDLETNLTAAITCVSNVGPGLGFVGPAGNFAGYGPFAKLVLSFLMLCGRLELFPMLVMFHPALWKH